MHKLKDKSSPRGGRYSFNPTHLCTDSKGIILQASEAARDLMGRDLTELIGCSLLDFFTPTSAKKLSHILSSEFDSEKIVLPLEMEKEGRLYQLSFTITSEGRKEAKTINWITEGWSEDVHLLENKTALNESAVLSRISDPLISLDAGFHCNYINKAAASFWLLQPEDIIGNILWNIFPSLKGSALQKNIEKAWKDQQYRSFEEFQVKEEKWYQVSLYPSHDGITLQYKNITDSKKEAISDVLRHEVMNETLVELNDIIEYSTEVIFKIDVNGCYTFLSSEIERSLGYDPNQLKGKHLTSIIHPEDQANVMNVFLTAMKTKLPVKNVVYRIAANDGSYHWFSCSGSFVMNADGSPAYALGLAQDISDLKLALKQLEDSEQRYTAFLQNSSEAIWRFETPQGISIHKSPEEIIDEFVTNAVLAECNKAYSRTYGYEDEKEMIGMPLHQLLSSDDQTNLSYFQSFIESGFSLIDAESIEVDRFGNKKYILNNLTGIVEDEKLVRVWGTQRDITELKLAEKEVNKREVQYRTLAENVPAMIQRLDKNLRFTYVNKAVKETFHHHSPDGFVGKNMLELGLDPLLWKELKQKAESVFETGNAVNFTFDIPSLSTPNKKYHLLLNLSPEYDMDGKVASIIAIANDITPIVKTQAVLEYKDKLLATITDVTSAFLRSEDYRNILPLAIQQLGEATVADRVYIFEIKPDAEGVLKGRQTYEWCAPDISSQLDNQVLQNIPFAILGKHIQTLSVGKAVTLFTDQLVNEYLRKEFLEEGILSLLLMPIFVNQQIWGIVGFDDCSRRRIWTEEEKEVVKSFSSSLSSAISRDKAQVAIRESEERFRLMAGNAPVMMWVSNEQDELVYVNKSWTEFTGINMAGITGLDWSAIVHPQDISIAVEKYNKLIEKQETVLLEYRMRNANGAFRWVIDKANPRILPDGTFLGYTGSVIDIHDRKLMEEKLRFQARIMQEVSEAIVAVDLNYNIISWNRGAEIIYGYTAAESLGKPLNKLVPTQLINETIQQSLEHLNKYGMWVGEAYFDRRDGKRIYLHCSVVFLTDEKGNRIGYVGNNRDITDRRKSEEALRISEERYRTVVNSLGEGIILFGSEGRIIACNKSVEQILGMREEEIKAGNPLQNNWKSIYEDGSPMPPDQLPFAITMLTGRSLQNIILGLYRRTGELIWLSVNTEPIYYSQKRETPDAVVVSIVDITRRKRQDQLLELEKQVLQKNAQAQISLRSNIDHLLYGIEKLIPGVKCSVLMLEEDEKTILTFSAPSLPAEYSAAINGMQIGPNNASCGTAMFIKKNVIVSDISTDPKWEEYRDLAMKYDLKSCWSFPVTNAQNKVIASFAFYKSETSLPSEDEMVVIYSVLNILRVIIENKQSEEKIKISNERYLLATMATNDAIWDWDVIANTLYWGEGFHALFGYKAGYFSPETSLWDKNIHPQDKERVLNSMNHFIESNSQQVWQEEYRFRKSDGKYVLVTDRGFLIYNQQGKITRMVGSMQDITDKREMERKLLKQQINRQKLIAQAVVDAQEKERSIIGKELHDNVNQILSTAKLYLEVARKDEKDRISLMDMSTHNISEAINEIRTISRSLVPASIGDIGLVESIQDLMESIKISKTIEVSYEPHPEVDHVLTEPQKLMLFRIAQEQVNNILKHAQAQHLEFELTADAETVEMKIADDGIGFDSDAIRFKKGVGLSNIASRAELFSGKVDIISAPGKGCTLKISVPITNQ